MSGKNLLVIGAGAAGLFCAALLCTNGIPVTIVERGNMPGKKLSASGGGYANFSNCNLSPAHYLCFPEADFCAPALKRFGTNELLRQMHIWKFPIVEKDHGRLFLGVKAKSLTQKLVQICKNNGCDIILDNEINSIKKLDDCYKCSSAKQDFMADKIILACGSSAYPTLSGTTHCWKWLKNIGYDISPQRAALCPFYWDAGTKTKFGKIAGIGVPVRLTLDKCIYSGGKKHWDDDLLFTHTGLSGPAALQASLYWQPESEMRINFLPLANYESLLDKHEGVKTPRSVLRRHLPDKLIDALLPQTLARTKIAELSRENRHFLGNLVNDWPTPKLKAAGIKKAEVCAGGINVNAINPYTMQSRNNPEIYIIGELCNITGELGGYNLHWAFASAFCAATHILKN